MSSFKVVQVIPALESGGVERGTIDVANYLAELKIHNSIISNGGLLENELNQEFIDHFKLPVHSKNPLVYFNLAKKIFVNTIARPHRTCKDSQRKNCLGLKIPSEYCL